MQLFFFLHDNFLKLDVHVIFSIVCIFVCNV